MTPEEFIAAIKTAVHDSAVESVIETVEDPPGRKPAPMVTQLSGWYKGLSEPDQAMARAMVLHGVHAALFGFLAVIDGVRATEAGNRGFNLHPRGSEQDQPINSESVMLHDIYQSEVWDQVFARTAP